MRKRVILDERAIYDLLQRADVLAEFPQFKAASLQPTAAKASCRACQKPGGGLNHAAVKQAVLALPAASRERLKTLLDTQSIKLHQRNGKKIDTHAF